jgi:uncharacterized membrane protein
METFFTPLALACAAIAAAGVLVNFIFVALRFSDLPDRVPRHYGFTGRPDAWSGKGIIWVYPSIALVMLVAMTCVLITTSHKLRPEELSADIRRMSALCAFLSLVTLGLTMRTVAVAGKRAEGLGRLFLPFFMVGLVALMVVLGK